MYFLINLLLFKHGFSSMFLFTLVFIFFEILSFSPKWTVFFIPFLFRTSRILLFLTLLMFFLLASALFFLYLPLPCFRLYFFLSHRFICILGDFWCLQLFLHLFLFPNPAIVVFLSDKFFDWSQFHHFHLNPFSLLQSSNLQTFSF